MAGYTTVTTFFDESGKFNDHDVISFGGVSGYAEHVNHFANEWGRLLHQNGMKEFSVKSAFNHRRPLGNRNKALGVRARVAALKPFVQCIRTHLSVVSGVAIDVVAFKAAPPKLQAAYTKDPIIMAFLRALIYVLDFTPKNDKVSFICDDDEAQAWNFYQLYRRVKKIWPGARKKLAALSFADDEFLWGLQAADLVSGLMRMEARKLWFKTPYQYRSLFKLMSATPTRGSNERIWACDIAFVAKKNINGVADGIKDDWLKAINEQKE